MKRLALLVILTLAALALMKRTRAKQDQGGQEGKKPENGNLPQLDDWQKMLLAKQQEIMNWATETRAQVSQEVIDLWQKAWEMGQQHGQAVYDELLKKCNEMMQNYAKTQNGGQTGPSGPGTQTGSDGPSTPTYPPGPSYPSTPGPGTSPSAPTPPSYPSGGYSPYGKHNQGGARPMEEPMVDGTWDLALFEEIESLKTVASMLGMEVDHHMDKIDGMRGKDLLKVPQALIEVWAKLNAHMFKQMNRTRSTGYQSMYGDPYQSMGGSYQYPGVPYQYMGMRGQEQEPKQGPGQRQDPRGMYRTDGGQGQQFPMGPMGPNQMGSNQMGPNQYQGQGGPYQMGPNPYQMGPNQYQMGPNQGNQYPYQGGMPFR